MEAVSAEHACAHAHTQKSKQMGKNVESTHTYIIICCIYIAFSGYSKRTRTHIGTFNSLTVPPPLPLKIDKNSGLFKVKLL